MDGACGLKAISGKRLCQILEAYGWVCKRINGSHHIYSKTGELARITVPVHGNEDLKIGLLKSLMKIADIKEYEL